MRIVALISWYDEPVSWLAETVASAARMCDHVLAVDGAYASFPGALRRPSSPTQQADVIAHTASGFGVGTTIHQQSSPWWGGEVEKRDWMFKAASLLASAGDWLFVIDADEVLTQVPPDTRDLLKNSAHEVGEVLHQDVDQATTFDRRFIRVGNSLSVEGNHFSWISTDVDGNRSFLRGNYRVHDLATAEPLWDVRLEHRQSDRSAHRQAAKADYYAMLPDLERDPKW